MMESKEDMTDSVMNSENEHNLIEPLSDEIMNNTGYFDAMNKKCPSSSEIISASEIADLKRRRERRRGLYSTIGIAACIAFIGIMLGPISGIFQDIVHKGWEDKDGAEPAGIAAAGSDIDSEFLAEFNQLSIETADKNYSNVYKPFQVWKSGDYSSVNYELEEARSVSSSKDLKSSQYPDEEYLLAEAPMMMKDSDSGSAPSVPESPPDTGYQPEPQQDTGNVTIPEDMTEQTEQNDESTDESASPGRDPQLEDPDSSESTGNEDVTVSDNTGDQDDPEYSDTNIQTEGVQEADVVKTDGRYIYTANSEYIYIIEANNGHPRKIAEIPQLSQKAQTCFEMYVTGDRLVLLRAGYSNGLKNAPAGIRNKYSLDEGIIYPGNGLMVDTSADVYDISNRSAPKKLQSLSQSGSYNNSRMIGDVLYLISNYDTFDKKAVKEDEPRSFIPLFAEGSDQSMAKPKDISLLPYDDYVTFTVVSGIDTKNAKFIDNESILSDASTVYCGTDNLYLISGSERTETKELSDNTAMDSYISISRLTKISLNRGKMKVLATAEVDGVINNQFSLDEKNGVLRMVTTDQRWTESYYTKPEYYYDTEESAEMPEDSNNNPAETPPIPSEGEVWVGDEDGRVFFDETWEEDNSYVTLFTLDKNLNILGRIDNLAPGEEVYSCRFMGDIGYFVTFREVDPLFSVDLKNPKNPKVLGKLKIPGFSEYLQHYDKGLLFGLGMNADEDGDVDCMKLSMFNNSDPTDVKEADTLILKDLYYSEASENHKAILADVRKNIIAFPAEDKYVICTYDNNKGFKRVVDIKFDNKGYDYDEWFSSLRGMFIGDVFYVISSNNVNAYDILDGFKNIDRLILSETADAVNVYGYYDFDIPEEALKEWEAAE